MSAINSLLRRIARRRVLRRRSEQLCASSASAPTQAFLQVACQVGARRRNTCRNGEILGLLGGRRRPAGVPCGKTFMPRGKFLPPEGHPCPAPITAWSIGTTVALRDPISGIGRAAADTFGPVMRFAVGAGYATPLLAAASGAYSAAGFSRRSRINVGRLSLNMVLPGSDTRSSRSPPCARNISCAIARPNPLPPLLAEPANG